MEFLIIAEIFERMETTTKRIELTNILVELFKKIPKKIIPNAVYLLQGIIRPNFEGVELGIAEKLAIRAISKSSGLPIKKIENDYKDKGDLGLTASNILKLKTQTKCIKYSDKLSLSFEKRGRTFTVPWTAPCNSNWGSWNGDWHVVHKMHGVFKWYFQSNPNVQFKNPISSKQGFTPTCPSLGDAKNMLPGETCITYESLGSRAVSGEACANKGFNTWLLIVSKLPNDEFYFNCAGKIW